MKQLTEKQYNKLIDCEVLQSDYITYCPAKFYSRGRANVSIARKNSAGDIFISSYSCGMVKINGIQLEYISRYSFTNPKNPFKAI